MTAGWMGIVFGTGTWTLWYGSLFIAFLMLLGTGVYACLDPVGPGAGPMLMLMVFVLAFAAMVIVTSVDVAVFAKGSGSGYVSLALYLLVTWIVVGISWTFLFWATDPNYPEMLLPGRTLFIAHSILLYGFNLWLLRRIQRR
jgi:hypothetical protein